MEIGEVAAAPQPEHFSFTEENCQEAEKIIARYPQGRQASAVLPLLMLAQKQNDNWLPKAAMDEVARILSMPPVRVWEVATFYNMYNLTPVGRHVIEICTTTPCWLQGSGEIVTACERHLGVRLGETTQDGKFTLREVECLGACVNAPMLQADGKFYEDLTPKNVIVLLDAFERGETPKPGPQEGRRSSEPAGGLTSLNSRREA